jgi:hypothetical protein
MGRSPDIQHAQRSRGTHQDLVLPNFLLIGAAKCGTTTLYDYLDEHPGVQMSSIKEPAYFSNPAEYEKGLGYYSRTHFGRAEDRGAIGEATPWYLYVEGCAERIKTDLPTESHRFIVILRDPIARGYSMYWDQARGGREQRGFTDIVDAELNSSDWPSTQPECRQSYVRCGRYERFLSTYLHLFGSERLLILFQEDLTADVTRGQLLDSVARFLSIDPEGWPGEAKVSNQARSVRSVRLQRWLNPPTAVPPSAIRRAGRRLLPRHVARRTASMLARLNRTSASYAPMPADVRERLTDYYRPTVQQVQDLAGRDLSHWMGHA